MALRRFLAILTATLVILLIIAVWFFPSNEDFRVENPFWNGTRDAHNSYQTQPLASLADLPPSPTGITLILVPYLSGTPAELEQLSRFVTRGGTLVLADDYGHGNQILEHLGLKARFSGQPLLDPLINYKNEYFPRITHLEPGPLTGNSGNLVFNHATCLINIAAPETLARSSSFSFLDQNDSGTWDEGETAGPLPVISHHQLGRGQVILISDPSLFINGMTIEDNKRLMQNIAAATLYIDQSHLPQTELHQTKNLLTQVRGFLATPIMTAALVILALIIILKPVWHKREKGTEDTP